MKNKILRPIVAYPKAVLALFLALAAFFGYYSTKLEIDASSQTLLLDNDVDLEIWREVSKRYETPNFLVIAYHPSKDLFSQDSLNLIKNLSDEIGRLNFVDSVINITNVPLLMNKNGMKITDLMDGIPTLLDENISLQNAKKEFKTSPLYASNLISKDLSTTAIMINLKPDLKYENFIFEKEILSKKEANKTISSDEKIALSKLNAEFKIYRDENRIKEHENLQQLRDLIAKYKDSQNQLFLGGMGLIADDMINFVRNDVVVYGGGALLLLLASFWLFFKQVKFVLIPLVICLFSVVLASGLFGFLGYEITVISSNYIALQLIVTVSVCIHLIVAYREFSTKFPHFSQRQITYATLLDRAKPCFYAILTTIIGFFSLILCDIKPVISLGIMMSVGIAVSLITAFALFGAISVLTKKIKIDKSFEKNFSLTKHCANLAINHRKSIYFICILAVIFGVFGISKLKVENSFIGYFKQSTEIYAGMAVIDKELGGTVPLDVVVKFDDKNLENSQNTEISDDFMDEFENEFAQNEKSEKYWFNAHRMRIINKIHDFLKEREFIGNVSSLSMLLKIGKELNGGEDLDDFMLAAMNSELPQQYKKIILTPYVSIENNEAHFSVRTRDSDPKLRRDEFLKNLQKDLDELTKNDGVSVEVSGVMKLYNNMLQSLMSSQIGTLGFTLIVLFVIFVIVFKSFTYAFIAIVVNVIPLSVGFGIMGFLGIPLDIMSITIAAISVGIGVDDVIHYIFRYKNEVGLRLDKISAIYASHASIGYAMYYTSFAVVAGFCVMTLSNFWPTIYFGILIDLVMLLLLFGALLILPAMILTLMPLPKK